MSINKILNLLVILTGSLILILYLYLWNIDRNIESHLSDLNSSYLMLERSSDLLITTDKYLTGRDPSVRMEWLQAYDQIVDFHSTNHAFGDNLGRKLQSIDQTFRRVTEIYRNNDNYQDREIYTEITVENSSELLSEVRSLLTLSRRDVNRHLAEINKLHGAQRKDLLFLLIPSLVVLSILLFFIRRRISHSFNALLAGTERFKNGQLDTRITGVNNLEPRKLASSFNAMASQLQLRIETDRNLRITAEENQNRWEQLVAQDPCMITIHINGVIQFINKAGANLIGFDNPADANGRSIYDFLDEDHHQEASDRISRVMNEKENVSPRDYKFRTYRGDDIYLKLESKPIKYDGKDSIQTVGLDITPHILYEEKLKESLAEKEVLLQEVHHRVKNNLAIVSGLLTIKKFDTNNDELAMALNESELQIKSIALIHEKIYRSSDFSKIELSPYIRDLFVSIRSAYSDLKDVNLSVKCPEIRLNLNQAIPIGLFINELILNSFKHAFDYTDQKKITLRIKEEFGRIGILYRDNGVGLPEGFDPQQSTSFGMTIMTLLAAQLDGDLEMVPDSGFVAKLSFDKKRVPGSAANMVSA